MRLWIWIASFLLVLIGAGALVTFLAARDVEARRAALSAEQQIAQTRHGPIAYTSWGEGEPVLVIHGAGGGYDQGHLIAEAFGGDGVRWIAISRFGYLSTPIPADASTPAQADAIADLLDALNIERVSVLAFSGGVPPALQLAERHPARVTRMALLSSAPFTPYAPETAARPIPDWVYQSLFGNDAVYWVLAKINRRGLEAAFDTRPELRDGLSREEKHFVARLVDSFLPASARVDGVRNEGAAIDPNVAYTLENIATPTLIIHARDDHLNQFAIGEALAARLPNAEFAPLPSGGHLLLGQHALVRARVSAFLTAHAYAPP
jgi:pimeloyl-ACP methyl ester carboxylesterase